LEQIKQIARRLSAEMGDLLLIIAGCSDVVDRSLSGLRQEMGHRLKLAEPSLLAFVFVTDFPLLAQNEETRRWEPMHHPFTAPREEDIPFLDANPEKVQGRHYDVICNGYEIAGGSIRIHTSEMQRRIFKLLGYEDSEIEGRFGHLLRAFDYGAPPHGGIALGIDRIVMLLAGEETIREVIPFPKNQNAVDMLFDAPASVTEEQLADLHLCLRREEE
jgi:aspartyl-tRNA synthetase